MADKIILIEKLVLFFLIALPILVVVNSLVENRSKHRRVKYTSKPPNKAVRKSADKVPARWKLEDPNDLEATIATLEEERSRLIDYAQALELEAERLKIKKPLKSNQLLVKAAGLDKKIVQIEIAISNYKKFN